MRVVVSEELWGQVIRDAAPPGIQVNVVTVALPSLHQVLTHAVAEGRAPDLAILDSVWIAEFAASGFLYALEDLDEHWVRYEHEVDFLEPLVSSNRSGGRTFGVSAFGSVAGIWYRRRELAALGLEPPRTWDELRAVAPRARRRRHGHAVRHAGRLDGRRDDRLLPDRVPGVERRARARRRRASASTRPRRPRRSSSCAA